MRIYFSKPRCLLNLCLLAKENTLNVCLEYSIAVILEPVNGYHRYINRDCFGNDISGGMRVSSANECSRLCDNTIDCVGFVFRELLFCHLKNVCEEFVEELEIHAYTKAEGKKVYLWY